MPPPTSSSSGAVLHEYAGRDLEAMDFAVNYHRWIRDEFRPFLGSTVAEVGAGTGSFSRLLLELDEIERLIAIEPSEAMHATLAVRLGGDSRVSHRCATFGEAAAEYRDQLDAVAYVNVLEHIENDVAEFSVAYDALRPGGHLCVFVPALRWLYSDFDATLGHYRRYAKRELQDKVLAAGYEVARLRYFDAVGVLPWLVVFRALGRTLVGRQVRTYDSLVVPLARRIETVAAPPIGKNLLLVARKPALRRARAIRSA